MHSNGISKRHTVYTAWLFGLLLGIFTVCSTSVATIHGDDIFMPVTSPLSVAISSCLPVLLSILLIQFRNRFLLLILIFLKAYVIGYSILWLISIQQGNGILLLWFHLLSGSCSSACIIFLSLDHSDGSNKLLIVLLVAIVSILDCLFSFITVPII